MTIHWLYATPANAAHANGSAVQAQPVDGTNVGALADLVPSVLAFLDFASLRHLSQVCRAAAQSSVRALVLQRSVLQISTTSYAVHSMLRGMTLRSHLGGLEVRNCYLGATRSYDLPTLVADVKRVKFSDDVALDQEVLDEANSTRASSGMRRKLGEAEFIRHVRQRLNASRFEYLDFFDAEYERGAASKLMPWFAVLPPMLTDMDFSRLAIDNFGWVGRFPMLKRLHFDASTATHLNDLLAPLALATCLEELVVTNLKVEDGSTLSALKSLRKLELRDANWLRDVDFLRGLSKLESLVLSEIKITDLTPLTALPSLTDLMLDSIGSSPVRFDDLVPQSLPHVAVGGLGSSSSPAFPNLKSIQILFSPSSTVKLLSHSPQLTEIHLCNVILESWVPLKTLPMLEQVSLSVDGIRDWSPLASLPRLRRLALESAEPSIRSQFFGSGWKSLEEIISPPWDDYAPLTEHAPLLRQIRLHRWRARDSSSLAALKNAKCLTSLQIYFLPGPIELSSIGELTQLHCLELWAAPIVSIEFLRGMANLIELKLPGGFQGGVSIVNFSPLTQLTNLRTIVLSGRGEFKNKHLDLLGQLPKLKNVDVSESGVTSSFLKKLRVRYNTSVVDRRSRIESEHPTNFLRML